MPLTDSDRRKKEPFGKNQMVVGRTRHVTCCSRRADHDSAYQSQRDTTAASTDALAALVKRHSNNIRPRKKTKGTTNHHGRQQLAQCLLLLLLLLVLRLLREIREKQQIVHRQRVVNMFMV